MQGRSYLLLKYNRQKTNWSLNSNFQQFWNWSLVLANFHIYVQFYYWLFMLKVVCQSNMFKGTLRTTKRKIGRNIYCFRRFLIWVITFPFWATPTVNVCTIYEQNRLKDANSMVLTHIHWTNSRIKSRGRDRCSFHIPDPGTRG